MAISPLICTANEGTVQARAGLTRAAAPCASAALVPSCRLLPALPACSLFQPVRLATSQAALLLAPKPAVASIMTATSAARVQGAL